MDRERLESTAVRWMWRIATPAVCVLLIGLAVRDAPYAYDARFGSGTEGTFTVTHVTSGRSAGCSGNFVSDDGSTVRRDVALVPGRRGDVGDRIAAVDVGNPRGVYPADSAHDWLLATILGGASIIILLVWAITMTRRYRRRGAQHPRPPRVVEFLEPE